MFLDRCGAVLLMALLSNVAIRCHRKTWLIVSALMFWFLAQWRWIEMKGPPFSLYDWVWADLSSFARDIANPGEVLAGILFLGLWVLAYIAVALFLGWVIAAIISTVITIYRVRNQPGVRGHDKREMS